MVKIRTILLASGLVAVVAIAALLLLQACGLAKLGFSGFSKFCTAPIVIQDRKTLVALNRQTETLQQSIAFLESELAAKQCTAQYPKRVEAPAAPAIDPVIDTEVWKRRDLAVLDGCWKLDSEYKVVNRRTGVVTSYNKWSMCFNTSGVGKEDMLSSNGAISCHGPVSGAFNNSGKLVIKEPANLPCSDSSYIYRRIVSCTLNTDGTASCQSRQPEDANKPTQVRLRRIIGGGQ